MGTPLRVNTKKCKSPNYTVLVCISIFDGYLFKRSLNELLLSNHGHEHSGAQLAVVAFIPKQGLMTRAIPVLPL